MLWKTLHHSEIEWFDVSIGGENHLCSFVIIDDRLITVSAEGHKRTVELGHVPPLALAEAVAAELLFDAQPPAMPAT